MCWTLINFRNESIKPSRPILTLSTSALSEVGPILRLITALIASIKISRQCSNQNSRKFSLTTDLIIANSKHHLIIFINGTARLQKRAIGTPSIAILLTCQLDLKAMGSRQCSSSQDSVEVQNVCEKEGVSTQEGRCYQNRNSFSGILRSKAIQNSTGSRF